MNIILLGSRQRGRILRHFFALSSEDRMLRFGHVLSDPALLAHVQALDFKRDILFGVVRGRSLLALAHLALPPQQGRRQEAELGLSVLAQARGHGLGSRLFARALHECRQAGVNLLFMHCLASNHAMLHIAKKAGMDIVQQYGEADARMKLPALPPLKLPQLAPRRADWARKN